MADMCKISDVMWLCHCGLILLISSMWMHTSHSTSMTVNTEMFAVHVNVCKWLQVQMQLPSLLCVLRIARRRWVYLDSHIFTMGFAVTLQQMWIVCPRYGFCWTVLRGRSGPFNSPPDLTPFTLDKHNTKEKCTFYVRGWVITCRKKYSLVPLGV